MTEKHDLDFPVVSDPGNQLARALGVVMRPTEAYLASQLESGLDLTTVNADGTVELAIPTTAIIDPDGRLVWIDVRPEISVRTDPHEILDALRGLGL
jgi:peroxiredoxin